MKFLLIFFVASLSICNCNVIVTTKNGKVQSKTLSFENKTINYFNGIPFAKPPLGDLRFKKPQPYGNWSGIVQPNEKRVMCMQRYRDKYGKAIITEDCLTLSIWSPASNSCQLKAVMFYIFAGAFRFGRVMEPDEGIFMASHDVVVVSPNHRVNAFGYVFSGNEEAPGNVGLHDHILAMQWVKDNIEYFGGDPKKVTIFGISSAGMSVGFHLVSPLSKGLFQRAIMSSGSAYSFTPSFSDRSMLLQRSKELSEEMNCTVKNDEEWIKCLKRVNASDIAAAKSFQTHRVPLVGDELVPSPASRLVRDGRINDIELMAGVTANESSLEAALLSKNINKTEFIRLLPTIFNDEPFNYTELIQHYVGHLDEHDSVNIRKAYGFMKSDYSFICPTYLMAKDISMKNFSTRFYHLEHKANKSYIPLCTDKYGSCHAEDLPFIYGLALVNPNEGYTDVDKKFTRYFGLLWTNFAKTGNPMSGDFSTVLSGTSTLQWPTLTDKQKSDSPNIMKLNGKEYGNILVDPYSVCDTLWRKYFV